MIRNYKAIIFDVGDTLVKWFPNRAEIYPARLRQAGAVVDESLCTVISDTVYRAEGEQIRREQNGALRMPEEEFHSMLDRAALGCLPVLPEPVDAMVEKLKAIPLPKQEMRVIPGVHRLLGYLKGAGCRLAIVSNHWQWLIGFLEKEELAGFFEAIVVSQVVGVEKPNVRIMEIALERLGLPAWECLYVGDHEMDVLCAKQAGLDMAWIAPEGAALPEDIGYAEDFRIPSVLSIAYVLGL